MGSEKVSSTKLSWFHWYASVQSERGQVNIVLVNFTKAFDTKLIYYCGIRSNFKNIGIKTSFLADRRHHLVVVASGVPQGALVVPWHFSFTWTTHLMQSHCSMMKLLSTWKSQNQKITIPFRMTFNSSKRGPFVGRWDWHAKKVPHFTWHIHVTDFTKTIESIAYYCVELSLFLFPCDLAFVSHYCHILLYHFSSSFIFIYDKKKLKQLCN